MDQPGVPMKAKDNKPVFREERIVIRFGEPMRVLGLRLQFHEIDDINYPDFQAGQMLAKDRNGSQYLQRRRVSATGHDHIRLGALVVAGPLPDTDSFRAMYDRLFHS